MKIILCEKQFIVEWGLYIKKIFPKDITDLEIPSWNLNSVRHTTIRLTNKEYIGQVDCLKLKLKYPKTEDYETFYCHSESECCLYSNHFETYKSFKKVKDLHVGEEILSDPSYVPGGPFEFVSYEEIGKLDAWSYDVIFKEGQSVLVCSYCSKSAGLSLK